MNSRHRGVERGSEEHFRTPFRDDRDDRDHQENWEVNSRSLDFVQKHGVSATWPPRQPKLTRRIPKSSQRHPKEAVPKAPHSDLQSVDPWSDVAA